MNGHIPEPDEVLSIARDLKTAREMVQELEEKWASLFTVVVSQPTPVQVPLKTRIISLLAVDPERDFSTATVSAVLEANPNSIGPYLSDLATEGKIERRGRGLYGALRATEEDNPFDEDDPFAPNVKEESPATVDW